MNVQIAGVAMVGATDWEQAMRKKIDLIVIGTGAAATGVASRCKSAGWEVAIVDNLPYGGTCQLRGCDPKKVLVGAADAIDRVHRLEGKGIQSGSAKIDWKALMRFKHTFVASAPEGNERWLSGSGVETLHGHAHFVGPTAVVIEGEALEGRYVHIATGATPANLGIPGQEHFITSTDFLELKSLPTSIVFVGGGFISFEFAHVAARAGAQVTLLHRSTRPLAGFDPDLVDMLVERTRKLGINVKLEAEACEIESSGKGFTVHAKTPEGRKPFTADLVVHGAGRVPNVADLNLGAAGIAHGPRGIEVNEYMQSTTNSSVYAAGDCANTAGLPLTPVGAYEGSIAATNLLDGGSQKASHPPMPSTVFTIPPLASVGLQENEAREKGLRFETHFDTTSSWYSSRRIGEEHSAYKVLVEEGTGQILGAHILGSNAEELINLFTMAIKGPLTAQEIKEIIFAYPTYASDMGYMV